MERSELDKLVLAALLHDVGKFAQRARAGKNQDMEGEYCPTAHGHSTHTHVLYSDFFIEKTLPLPQELADSKNRSQLARLASAHHKPDASDLLEQSLSIADRLSAGTDRKSGEEGEGDFRSARLLSIFEQLSFTGPRPLDSLQQGHCYRLAPLTEDPFPVLPEVARESDYSALFADFCAHLKDLPLEMGVAHYTAALTSLLEEYTWCIPSSTYKSLADISLYDHAVTTAAIAQALAFYHTELGGLPGQNAETTPKFLLLGGDLSGIQKYIFDLDKSHGSGVAKLFRARSFFLQMLTRSVVLDLLQKLGLSSMARIIDAGGRFILLLPATDRVRKFMPAFELEVQRWFFNRFRGELCLNLCWNVELTEADCRMERFQQRLDDFNDALEERKLHKFDRLMAEGLAPVIELDYAAYADGDCPICHKRPVDRIASEHHRGNYGVEVDLCHDCAEQIEMIGSRLPRCEYLIFRRGGEKGVALFADLQLHLVQKIDPKRHKEACEIVALHKRGVYAYQPIATHLPTISETDLSIWRGWNDLQPGSVGGWQFRDEPVVVGEPKTFSLMARSAREMDPDGSPVGRSFLGAFKADVDNLGLIFSIGLQDRLSISRFASLSRMLNHFFSDDLVRWIKQEHPDLYVVFAGGDDLFLIGPWRQTVRFAEELHKRFARFVANRPIMTLSAGVAVIKPSLPVRAIAEQAEELLERAKHLPQKNGVSLFDTCVPWDEFAGLIAKGDWLHALVRDRKVPRGLLGRLLYYGNERRAFLAGEIKRGIYLSHMNYDFARNITEKIVRDPQERSDILALQKDERLLEKIRLPVTWALYRQRRDS
ncbi:MAG: type III-A CRISPR-associated protein Cas10/Csm1 [Sulfuriflexus sp.]|nr:type III-A CRISPR-associated protein Cas10/Csm1 [Sulfuriflexus sp.]